MTFSYKDFATEYAGATLWQDVINELQSLNLNQMASAKIATSDTEGSDARGLIFYCDSPMPNQNELGTTWAVKTFTTMHDYTTMYQELETWLNTGGDLTDAQKYFSRMAMTNMSTRHANLELFYRLPKDSNDVTK